jgi:hypothetical protein
MSTKRSRAASGAPTFGRNELFWVGRLERRSNGLRRGCDQRGAAAPQASLIASPAAQAGIAAMYDAGRSSARASQRDWRPPRRVRAGTEVQVIATLRHVGTERQQTFLTPPTSR